MYPCTSLVPRPSPSLVFWLITVNLLSCFCIPDARGRTDFLPPSLSPPLPSSFPCMWVWRGRAWQLLSHMVMSGRQKVDTQEPVPNDESLGPSLYHLSMQGQEARTFRMQHENSQLYGTHVLYCTGGSEGLGMTPRPLVPPKCILGWDQGTRLPSVCCNTYMYVLYIQTQCTPGL